MNIVLIGIQGSGKSTQGNLLAGKLDIPYLSTGHILREMSKEKTRLGRYIKETINAGYLLPDKDMIPIVFDYLSRNEYKGGYILDGFPRTVAQAKAFKGRVDAVIYLIVSDKEALWRLAYRTDGNGNSREDETVNAIRKRIELFHKFTKPVLGLYKRRGKLIEINGEQPIKTIHRQIMKQLRVLDKKNGNAKKSS